MTNYMIARIGVTGLKRPMSTSFINYRHFMTFIIRDTIVIEITGGILSGLFRQIYKPFINTNLEITLSADLVVTAILVLYMGLRNEMCWNQG